MEKIGVRKGRDGPVNIRILEILLEHESLSYVEIAKILTDEDLEDARSKYRVQKKWENRAYRRCKALQQGHFIEQVESKYALTWKGFIVLGIINKDLKNKILKNERYTSYKIVPRNVPGLTFIEPQILSPEEHEIMIQVYNLLLPYCRPLFWGFIERGILSEEINIDTITETDLGSWFWDQMLPALIMPRRLQTMKGIEVPPSSLRKKILADKKAKSAIKKLRKLMMKVVNESLDAPL